MVAITVILAAVIASFVLGFGDSVQENVQAGASISVNDDGTATVTWVSEGNADAITVNTEPTSVTGHDTTKGSVGATVSLGDDAGTEDQVTVTVLATDNSSDTSTVVAQKEITIKTA